MQSIDSSAHSVQLISDALFVPLSSLIHCLLWGSFDGVWTVHAVAINVALQAPEEHHCCLQVLCVDKNFAVFQYLIHDVCCCG